MEFTKSISGARPHPTPVAGTPSASKSPHPDRSDPDRAEPGHCRMPRVHRVKRLSLSCLTDPRRVGGGSQRSGGSPRLGAVAVDQPGDQGGMFVCSSGKGTASPCPGSAFPDRRPFRHSLLCLALCASWETLVPICHHRNVTAECETGQIWPISRRRSPNRPAKVKPAATAEITTRGKRVRL